MRLFPVSLADYIYAYSPYEHEFKVIKQKDSLQHRKVFNNSNDCRINDLTLGASAYSFLVSSSVYSSPFYSLSPVDRHFRLRNVKKRSVRSKTDLTICLDSACKDHIRCLSVTFH